MNPIRTSRVRTLSFSTASAHDVDLADLVRAAIRGDLRAVDALADGYRAALVAEALDVLGPLREEEAEHVADDFFNSLSEGKNRFLPRRDYALAWMGRIVRAIAHARCCEDEEGGR